MLAFTAAHAGHLRQQSAQICLRGLLTRGEANMVGILPINQASITLRTKTPRCPYPIMWENSLITSMGFWEAGFSSVITD